MNRRFLKSKCKSPGCKTRIWKGTRCAACRKKQLETTYGLSFNGNYAKPSEKFWTAWREDKDAVKRQGLCVEKDGQQWFVRKAQRLM